MRLDWILRGENGSSVHLPHVMRIGIQCDWGENSGRIFGELELAMDFAQPTGGVLSIG